MGSLAAVLNVPERARILHQAGLRLVLAAPARATPETLPAEWEAFLAKAPARPRVVFTYVELARDLGKDPDPARGELFRGLARHLAWPRGSIAFVPCLCPSTNRPAPDLFRLCIERLNPDCVACFGAEAVAAARAAADGLSKIGRAHV